MPRLASLGTRNIRHATDARQVTLLEERRGFTHVHLEAQCQRASVRKRQRAAGPSLAKNPFESMYRAIARPSVGIAKELKNCPRAVIVEESQFRAAAKLSGQFHFRSA